MLAAGFSSTRTCTWPGCRRCQPTGRRGPEISAPGRRLTRCRRRRRARPAALDHHFAAGAACCLHRAQPEGHRHPADRRCAPRSAAQPGAVSPGGQSQPPALSGHGGTGQAGLARRDGGQDPPGTRQRRGTRPDALPRIRVGLRTRLPVIVHCGTRPLAGSVNSYADPVVLDEVMRDFPDLVIVLAHGGRGWWYDQAAFLALMKPNVWLEVSGLPPQRVADYYGSSLPRLADKMIFGTAGLASRASSATPGPWRRRCLTPAARQTR